jgi:C4-dicarboxylate-binding protein DctP
MLHDTGGGDATVRGAAARAPGRTISTRQRETTAAPPPLLGALRPLLLLLCSGLVARPALAETTTLRMTLPISADNPVGQAISDFARQVGVRTGGAVRIEVQGKGRRYEEHEVVTAVASGAIDMGATTLGQFAAEAPLAGVFLQPFLFNFDILVEAATERGSEIRALVEDDILYWTNARVLWWQPFGSSVIVSKATAVIASHAVGAPDHLTRALIQACGGTPHLVPPPEVPGALRTGTIKSAVTNVMNVRDHGLWQVADTVTDLRHAPSLFLVIVNERAWQRLAPAHRDIMSELAQEAQSDMWARFTAIRTDAYAFAKQKGMRIVDPRPEDVAGWRVCTAPLLEAYIERAGEAGPKLFAAYGRLRMAPCCRKLPVDARFMLR